MIFINNIHKRYLDIIILLIFVFALSSYSTEKKDRVGISPFKGSMYNTEQLQTLTMKFRDAFFRTGKVEVVEQSEMKSIMDEHGLGQAGCTDMSCYIEIGRSINISQMLFPSIAKVGNITSLSAKLVDIETGKIIRSATVDTRKPFKKLISKDIDLLAERIAGKFKKSKNVYSFDPTKKRRPVAVLDIKGYGITANESAGLTNRLRTELFNTGVFDVMEREQMVDILREQGLQQSGICSDEDCLVDAGQMIGVRYMIGGAVSRIGNMYSVSSRIIDVKNGRIIRTASEDVNANLNHVLKKTMNDIARAISGLKPYHHTNYTALSWSGGALFFAGLGAWFTKEGFDYYDQYKNEQYDLNKVADYKRLSKNKFTVSYVLYGVAGSAGGIALYNFVSKKIKLRIDQPEGIKSVSMALEVNFGK